MSRLDIWEKFFSPKSIAVIGASSHREKAGYVLLNNIISYGFKGKVYPINPTLKEILGIPVYRSVLEIPEKIDLAIIAIPPQDILPVLEECAQKGIYGLVVISAGFKEIGTEGAKIEREFTKRARELNIRFLGPNCLGIIDTHNNLNISFSGGVPPVGHIGFFSQSGALCTAMLDYAVSEGLGFSKFISIGNKADLSEIEILEVLRDDQQTKWILGYLEDVKDGREFMRVARELTPLKPLIMIKAGGTEAGAKAASSHTGALTGSDSCFEAAFKQTGIIRAYTIEELFNLTLAFAHAPLPKGPNLAILTNAGGPGIMAADALEKKGFKVAELSKIAKLRLREVLPQTASVQNPVDIIGDARAERYQKALEIMLEDPLVHGILVILTPQGMTEVRGTAEVIGHMKTLADKPIFASFMGRAAIQEGITILRNLQVPHYPYPEHAINAFHAMWTYARGKEVGIYPPFNFSPDRARVKKLFAKVWEEGRNSLAEKESQEVLGAYEISLPHSQLAETSDQAVAIAEQWGYPVALKIASPDILHKTDLGGVKLGLKNALEVKQAFEEIAANAKRRLPQALIWGVTVQEMVVQGKEVIVGLSKDPQFGPVLMFGLGGIYTEILRDITFRICPIDRKEAGDMIREIRSFSLLMGQRGEKPADIPALEETLLKVSQLAMDFPQIIEADINPLFVRASGEGVVAVDARFILKEE
jgi:acetyltransferase